MKNIFTYLKFVKKINISPYNVNIKILKIYYRLSSINNKILNNSLVIYRNIRNE